MSAGDRAQPLTVELAEGRLVISIGIDALMVAVHAGDDWPDDEYKITDPDLFAAGIVRGLEDEEEDGTTQVHLAIDTAALWALEQGYEGVEERPADERDGEDERDEEDEL